MDIFSARQSYHATPCSTAINFSVPQAVNPSLGFTPPDYLTHARIIQGLTRLGSYDTKYGWKPESIGQYARLVVEYVDERKRDQKSHRCGCTGCPGRNLATEAPSRTERFRTVHTVEPGVSGTIPGSSGRQPDVRIQGPERPEPGSDTGSHSGCGSGVCG